VSMLAQVLVVEVVVHDQMTSRHALPDHKLVVEQYATAACPYLKQ